MVTYKERRWDSYSNEYLGAVAIPNVVIHNDSSYSVTKIGEKAFNDCRNPTSISIPNSVDYIELNAFTNCQN